MCVLISVIEMYMVFFIIGCIVSSQREPLIAVFTFCMSRSACLKYPRPYIPSNINHVELPKNSNLKA